MSFFSKNLLKFSAVVLACSSVGGNFTVVTSDALRMSRFFSERNRRIAAEKEIERNIKKAAENSKRNRKILPSLLDDTPSTENKPALAEAGRNLFAATIETVGVHYNEGELVFLKVERGSEFRDAVYIGTIQEFHSESNTYDLVLGPDSRRADAVRLNSDASMIIQKVDLTPGLYSEGDTVEALNPQQYKFDKGVITRVHKSDSTYDIDFEDGTTYTDVSSKFMRKPKSSHTEWVSRSMNRRTRQAAPGVGFRTQDILRKEIPKREGQYFADEEGCVHPKFEKFATKYGKKSSTVKAGIYLEYAEVAWTYGVSRAEKSGACPQDKPHLAFDLEYHRRYCCVDTMPTKQAVADHIAYIRESRDANVDASQRRKIQDIMSYLAYFEHDHRLPDPRI